MPATQTAPIVAAHLIEGNETASISGETFETVDPSTGQPLGTVAFAQVDDVNRAVDSAANAFGDGRWYHLPPAERARRMRRVATLLEGNRDRLAELESRDSGAPLAKTRGDVSAAAALFDYFAQLPEHVSGRTYATEPGYLLYSSRVPYGVVGAIAPWNFPLLLACWKTAPALAVGNSVVLKMAEQTPLSTSEFGRICLEAGIPPGVINIVHGDGAVTG
ncbi:MAG TPA: aldehyde dehydrogenase family protein, partial [Jatrophihabitantaceae bacterium]